MGRGQNNGRAQRRRALAGKGGSGSGGNRAQGVSAVAQKAAAAFGATPMPSEVDAVEAAVFYQLVCSSSWEEVEAKVAQVVAQGLLTEGLLLAGMTVLEKARSEGEDPRTVDSIHKLCAHLTGLLQALKASPALQLMDEWAVLLEEDGNAGEEVQQKMREAFAEGRKVSSAEFITEVKGMLQRMQEQDREFEGSVRQMEEKGLTDEQKREVAEARKQREAAHQHVKQIASLAEALATAAA